MTKTKTNGQLSDDYDSNYLETALTENADILPDDLSGDENILKSNLPKQIKKMVEKKRNFFLTVMAVMKSVIGPGVLSLPYTISKLGYMLAILIFVSVMALSYFSTLLLIKVKNLSKHSNFSTIFYFLHESKLVKGLSSIFIVIKNVGICTAQLIIFRESIRKLIKDFLLQEHESLELWYTSQAFLVVFIAVFEFPLAVARKIESLRIFSFVYVSGVAFYLLCLLFHIFYELVQRGWQVAPSMQPFPQHLLKFSSVIPNVLLSLTFHANFFPIYKGMRNSNDHRITSACLTAIVTCGSIYLIVGLYTYMLYGSDLRANFLLCLHKHSTEPFLYYGMNAGILIFVIFAYPIVFFSARNNFIAVVKLFIAHYNQNQKPKSQILVPQKDDVDDDGIGSEQDYPVRQRSEITEFIMASNPQEDARIKRNEIIMYYGLTTLLYVLIILMAIFAKSIEFVFNGVGAICSATALFLFPYYFYFTITDKLNRRKNWIYYYTKTAFALVIPLAIFTIVVKYI